MKAFGYGTPKHNWDDNQKTLDNTEKDVLDITAGYRSMWKTYRKLLPDITRVIFLDKRPEVKPDVVAGHKQLPFRDASFNVVVYDPPHFVRPLKQESYYRTDFGKRFWAFNTLDDLIRDLAEVNREAARVLKPHGTLILKWCEIKTQTITHYNVVQFLTNFDLIISNITPSKGHRSKNKLYISILKKRL